MGATVENLNKEQSKEESKNDPQAIENAYKLLGSKLTPDSQSFQKELFAQDDGIDTLNAIQDGLEQDQSEKINDLKNQGKLGDATREGYDFSMEITTGGRSGNMKQMINFEVRDGNVYGSVSNTPREGMPLDNFYEMMAQSGQ